VSSFTLTPTPRAGHQRISAAQGAERQQPGVGHAGRRHGRRAQAAHLQVCMCGLARA